MNKDKFMALVTIIPPVLFFIIFIANMFSIIFTDDAFMSMTQCAALIAAVLAWIATWWSIFILIELCKKD